MRKYQVAAVAAAMCVLAAGCGSLRAGQPTGQPTRARQPASGSTLTGNRKLARAEARRLLARAPVPPGAVRIARPPRSLSMPAMGREAVGTLVDTTSVWRLPMSFSKAESWLSAQRPRGLPQDGSTRASDASGNTMTGYQYRGPHSPAWQSADLDLGVAPSGNGSVLRADGLVVWLDPRPLRDNTSGPRLRVTVTGGCPATDHNIVGVRNPGPGLDHRMVPAGRPVAGLECRYDGMNGHPWKLRRTIRLTRAQATREARSIARLPLSHTNGGVMNCPMDDGSAEVIVLAYPAQDVDLWATTNGCQTIANGHISAADY
jgi:hypothetical protein